VRTDISYLLFLTFQRATKLGKGLTPAVEGLQPIAVIMTSFIFRPILADCHYTDSFSFTADWHGIISFYSSRITVMLP
jgi:hypothetical protein